MINNTQPIFYHNSEFRIHETLILKMLRYSMKHAIHKQKPKNNGYNTNLQFDMTSTDKNNEKTKPNEKAQNYQVQPPPHSTLIWS